MVFHLAPMQNGIAKYIAKFRHTFQNSDKYICRSCSARLACIQDGIASAVNINCTCQNKLPKLYLQKSTCLFVCEETKTRKTKMKI